MMKEEETRINSKPVNTIIRFAHLILESNGLPIEAIQGNYNAICLSLSFCYIAN